MLLKLVFSLVAVGLIVMFVIIPVVKMLLSQPELPMVNVEEAFSLAEEEEELQIPAGGEKPDTFTMLEDARSDPQRTAMLVAAWLRNKD